MNNGLIVRQVELTASYLPLSSEDYLGDVTISSLPTNDTCFIRSNDGNNDDVPWLAGEWHVFQGINLASVLMKGTVGDVITIIGNRTPQQR